MIKTYDNFLNTKKCSFIKNQIENNLFGQKDPQILSIKRELSELLNTSLELQTGPFVISNIEINKDQNLFEFEKEGILKSKTAVIYLNDDYEGGNIYFKHHRFYAEPKTGKLLVFDRLSEEFWKFVGQERFYRMGWDPTMNYTILPVIKGKRFLLIIDFLDESTQ